MQAIHPDLSLLKSHGSIDPSGSFSGSLHSSFSADLPHSSFSANMPLLEVARLYGHPLRSPSAMGPNTTTSSPLAGSNQAPQQLPSAGRRSSALDAQTNGLRDSQALPHATRRHSQPPSIDGLRRSGSLQRAASPQPTLESPEEAPHPAMSSQTHSRSSKSRPAQHASRRQSLPAYLQPQMPAAAGHSRSSGPRALQAALHQDFMHPLEQAQFAAAAVPRPAPSPRASRSDARSLAGSAPTSDLAQRPQPANAGNSAGDSTWEPMPAPRAEREASPPFGTALAATARVQAQAATSDSQAFSDLLGDHPDPEDPTGLLGLQQGGRGRRKRQAGSRGDGLADELAALMAQQSWLQDAAGQAATSAIQGCVCISALISGHSPPHALGHCDWGVASGVLDGALVG